MQTSCLHYKTGIRFTPQTTRSITQSHFISEDVWEVPVTWGKLLEAIPPQKRTFHTQGSHLHDIRRQQSDPVGSISFSKIRKIEANSVRIVCAIHKDLQPRTSATDPIISNQRVHLNSKLRFRLKGFFCKTFTNLDHILKTLYILRHLTDPSLQQTVQYS
ncbi:hypothetical protein JOY44_23795 [Phormidium sp. CLA17]|uniref:hypothetical protein n=1 Tax=Leptolyngbya sp. Cla-17 TaxID=2803751 RepID=UPI0017BB9D00|nr:hypothetical protein [Leptolyngbya sp. Cla-17]MBM0744594.1 hypothetical protein [Leptolyngbya sp. Cla-17]